MFSAATATDYQKAIAPYKLDRIEVSASLFIDPLRGTYIREAFDAPRIDMPFSLLGEWHCEFPGGPTLTTLSIIASRVVGGDGFFGIKSGRRLAIE
jgi:hypothetical protein